MVIDVYDSLNILSKLTFKKLLNLTLLKLGYWLSVITKKVFVWGNPPFAAIEPTNFCNLHCPECPTSQLNNLKGIINNTLFENIINQLSPNLIYLSLYFQGEPLLHPKLQDLIRFTHQKKIYTSLSTNAQLLNEENAQQLISSGLDRIIISFDGTTEETYALYRKGGSLEKVILSINQLVEQKNKLKSKTPIIILQFVVFKHNEHQIDEAKLIAKNLKVDKIIFKSAQIYDYTQGSNLFTSIEKYNRYKITSDGSYKIKSKLPFKCWRAWSSPVITFEGNLLPCCFDKHNQYKVGTIKDSNITELWKNEKFHQFRNQILTARNQIDICTNCTEGLVINY